MLYYGIKVFLSAIIIVVVSEISKRSTIVGAILASVPLVSVLAIIWLYQDTKNTEVLIKLSQDIFWMVIPSLLFFIMFPICLRMKINFTASMIIALAIMIAGYFLMTVLLKQFGIRF